MKNRTRTYGAAAQNAASSREDLSPFFKLRIYTLLGFILLIWLIALLFALADIVPLTTQMKRLKEFRNNPAFTLCEPGPWGRMHYSLITIEAPESYLPPINAIAGPTAWVFKGYTEATLTTFIGGAALTEWQRDLFYRQSRWAVSPAGITVFPQPEFILDISPESRAYIYQELARFKENPTHFNPSTFNIALMEQWLSESGLQPEIQALISRLSYPRGAIQIFSDHLLVVAKLSSPEERLVFYKTLTRATSIFPKLHITRDSDIGAIARYWMKGSAKDIRPLLRSVSRVKDGYELDIVHLLPPVPRMLAYTYPNLAENDPDNPPDCHWTAVNFFNSSPDLSLLDADACSKFIRSEYYQVKGKPAFGDIIMFVTPEGIAKHSCNYIADGIVFTKNGLSPSAPWVFMKLDDIYRLYSHIDFQIFVYRRKTT